MSEFFNETVSLHDRDYNGEYVWVINKDILYSTTVKKDGEEIFSIPSACLPSSYYDFYLYIDSDYIGENVIGIVVSLKDSVDSDKVGINEDSISTRHVFELLMLEESGLRIAEQMENTFAFESLKFKTFDEAQQYFEDLGFTFNPYDDAYEIEEAGLDSYDEYKSYINTCLGE